jgi:hypothetical protein
MAAQFFLNPGPKFRPSFLPNVLTGEPHWAGFFHPKE